MLIAAVEGATRVLGKPLDWDESKNGRCGALPICDIMTPDGLPVMVSAWTPTPDELDRLNRGEPVYLWVYGHMHPPVALTVRESESGA